MSIIKSFLIIFCFLLIVSCNSEKSKKKNIPLIEHDLSDVLEDGKLKVSTTYSGTSYFLYRGEPMGFEYELLQRFAEYLDVELEIIVANDINNLIPNLNKGKVDLIAHGLTITNERKEQVSFSEYIFLTHQVLVQKKPDNWRKMKLHEIDRDLIQDAIELDNQTVSVRAKSTYLHRLENLSKEIGGTIKIDTIDGTLTTDEIIKMVVDGQIKYTVADNYIASIVASSYPILDVKVPISFSQRVAWATRTNSPKLLEALNNWLVDFKKEVDYYVIYDKYFENKRSFRKRIKSDFYSLNANKISEYDDLIKEHTKNNLGWDWRLVTALIYQESRFNPKANSWAGAGGLMQIMPETAKELGIGNRANPSESVYGGTKYLKTLWSRFDEIEDAEQRIKFAMASYNCGYSHVRDAQRLAEKRNLDKNLWDENVDTMILALSSPKNYNDPIVQYGYVRGIESFTYVEQIFERYEHYKEFIKE